LRLSIVATALSVTGAMHASDVSQEHQHKDNQEKVTKGATRSFFYGVCSAAAVAHIQSAIIARAVYYCLGIDIHFSEFLRNNKERKTSTSLVAAGIGIAATGVADTLFHIYGKNFWSGIDSDAKTRIVQEGYNAGRRFLSGDALVLNILLFAQVYTAICTYGMYYEAARFFTALLRPHLAENEDGDISVEKVNNLFAACLTHE